MLNQRQIEILLELWQRKGECMTASYFAKKLNVSLRTIQGDIKQIKKSLLGEECASVVSVASKGSTLKVDDEEAFSAFINTLYQEYAQISLNYPTSRINQILMFLLNQFRMVSMMDMEEQLHISHSTLLNDLKRVDEILEKFELELVKSDNRLLIVGLEINKRRCLAEKNIYFRHIKDEEHTDYIDEKQLLIIKNALMSILLEYRYHIADTEIQNAILRLNIMIRRLQRSFYIQPDEVKITDNLGEERNLSEDLFEVLSRKLGIRVTREEIDYFALYLKGQCNDQSAEIITTEMDAFILTAFDRIKQNFGIDFTDNINLRIALALHCTPLSIRIKYDMQLKNNMLDYIKQTFPLGYDIGISFALLLEEKYGKRLSEAEISLIAIHFYSSLLEVNNRKGTCRVLVISSLKNSMTMLLRQTLLKWFSSAISKLDFINPMGVRETDLDDYDVFLTTEKGEFLENGMAMYINAFPDNYDYLNMKLMLDGFKNIDDILEIFTPELFFTAKSGKKVDILRTLCLQSEEKFRVSTLYGEVLKREEMGSTYFSKGIAVPHPMHAVSSDTFVSVFVSEKPVVWDEEGNLVNVVALVCIGKNNPQAFQLWDYFSKIFADQQFVGRATENPGFDGFKQVLQEALKEGIKELE